MFSILGKTLFERIVQKIPDQVPIAIMTSPSNHAETVRYFEESGFFGRNISFFQQSTLPLLDADRLTCGIEGPDGNGSLYRSFVDARLADAWAQLGISTVTIIPVDNALANPLNPALLRVQEQSGSEVAICCIEREAPSEAMGVLIERSGKVEVLEYCDISSEQVGEMEPNGKLAYLYAYTGLVSMKLSFIYKAALIDLPLHWVQKTVIHQGKSWSIWKGEKFLFDAFPFAKSTVVLCRPREACYAPLKTREGPHGIDAVEKALCQ
jgi:UDP-N-acetylglucosamine pyrophosphorylase